LHIYIYIYIYINDCSLGWKSFGESVLLFWLMFVADWYSWRLRAVSKSWYRLLIVSGANYGDNIRFIHSIKCENESGEGRWFCDNSLRMVRDGERTLFWKDNWVDGILFRTQLSRLFELCLDKDKTVAYIYMFRLGSGFGGNGWRRRLFALGGCFTVLSNAFCRLIFLMTESGYQILI
jgi:hypothetical protein